MRGSRTDRVYRQVYAQCCDSQRRQFGFESLFFLSYESIFLYALAIDAGICSSPPATAVTCCRLRHRPENWPDFDVEFAGRCHCLALLLGSVKLEDDVRDERSLLARLMQWRFRRRFAAARAQFQSLDSQFEERVDALIRQHIRLEQSALGTISLEEYARPTADAFAYLFGLCGRRSVAGLGIEPVFERMGRAVGAAIIAYDCAVDYRRDLVLRRFNPLQGQQGVQRALEFAMNRLSEIGWECTRAFGSGSLSSRIARFNFDRIARYGVDSSRERPRPRHGVSRWRRGYRILRHGFCDCDCSGCEICCECEACHSCDACNVCDACTCGPDILHCWAADGSKQAGVTQATPGESVESALVGMTGTAVGPLNPTGMVLIGGEKMPAQSEGAWIEAGAEVKVVSEDPFGVVVRIK